MVMASVRATDDARADVGATNASDDLRMKRE
jgi:hypothetical protein